MSLHSFFLRHGVVVCSCVLLCCYFLCISFFCLSVLPYGEIKVYINVSCQLGDLCDAEDALTEANVLNNLEPEVWAYLCLLCLDTGRHVEAEQAYKYTLKVLPKTSNTSPVEAGSLIQAGGPGNLF